VTSLEIQTDRLVLRLPRLEDAQAALALYTDPVAMEFLGGVHPDAATDPEYVVRGWLERWGDNGCGPFSIVRRGDERWLGRAGLLVWDVRSWTHATFASAGEHAQPELGWALVRKHWGSGYASEAALAARGWAFRYFGVERLVSLIAPANVRSQRLAERLDATPGDTVELFDNGPHVVWEHPR
jgi:RimJ/RimL family protein N-acetyltransferase